MGSVSPIALAKNCSRLRSMGSTDAGSSWPIHFLSIMGFPLGSVSSHAFVQRHHAGAAQAQVVLQRQPRAFDLALVGGAAQLVCQFVALRQARGAQRMALAQQAAGRVGDDLAAVGVVAIDDELLGTALRAEAQRL